MPKKKADNITIMSEPLIDVECNCPYCGELNFTEIHYKKMNSDWPCMNCEKVFFVDIKNGHSN